jgi:epsilon-lactone hydrolase
MLDESLKQLIVGLRSGRPDFTAPPLETREKFAALLATLPVADDVNVLPDALGGVPGLRATTPTAKPGTALLYLHGGAYVAGSARGYLGLAAEFGRAAGVALVGD